MVTEFIKVMLKLLHARGIITDKENDEIEQAIKTDRYNHLAGDTMLAVLRQMATKKPEPPKLPEQSESTESFLNAAIEEIEYAVKTEKTKSAEVRKHYLENAVRYILMGNRRSNEVIESLTTQRDLARQAPFYQCPHCNERVRKE